ncbi:MAG TPA: hypothetical protein VNP04_32115 [Alphaproteobacteria bacterium]|nr:hypothetical protein [Alphaproteobacteria bacterium]
MSTAIFLRLLRHADKATAMAEAIAALREGHTLQSAVYTVDPTSFRQVPGSPFAYWVSERIRRLFAELPPFEGDGRTVRQGLATADDFRFVRAWWEVAPQTTLDGANGPDWRADLAAFQNWCRRRTFEGKRWVPFAKGGEYSPYYADLHLVVNWERDGEEIHNFMDPESGRTYSRPQNTDFYFRPGLTWPLRGIHLSTQGVPSGSIFSVAGKLATSDCLEELPAMLALMNSKVFDFLVGLFAGKVGGVQYEVGLIGRIPLPTGFDKGFLSEKSSRAYEASVSQATCDERCHLFCLPALLQILDKTLTERLTSWQIWVAKADEQLSEYQQKIDASTFQLYGIDGDDRWAIEGSLDEPRSVGNDEESDTDFTDEKIEAEPAADPRQLVVDLLSYAVGCIFGRWDVRFATSEREPPEPPNPFAPLPVCSPGMLIGDDGLPLREALPNYSLRIDWDGILVDDPDHTDDLVRRVREVLELVWKDRAEAIEHEACEILGVKELRDYFRKPGSGGFWMDHVRRYSKSRRKAPIYWPLSTASGSYTVWVYYQRLTDQTLYIIVNRYVDPKIAEVERTIAGVEKDMATASGRQASLLRDRWQEARAFLAELHDFREELLRVAGLPYKPDLNDGVIINAAPLHRLFRHRQWAKDTRDCWERLERGEYEWAHMAYTIWPERVRDLCRHDRSIAIAHGLEALYEPPSPSPGRRRRRQRG